MRSATLTQQETSVLFCIQRHTGAAWFIHTGLDRQVDRQIVGQTDRLTEEQTDRRSSWQSEGAQNLLDTGLGWLIKNIYISRRDSSIVHYHLGKKIKVGQEMLNLRDGSGFLFHTSSEVDKTKVTGCWLWSVRPSWLMPILGPPSVHQHKATESHCHQLQLVLLTIYPVFIQGGVSDGAQHISSHVIQLNFMQVNNKLSSFHVTSAVQYLLTFYFIDIPNNFWGELRSCH